jgi:hypothetical protein
MRIDADSLEESKAYPSKRAAVAAYAKIAQSLARFGQACVATLHYARDRDALQEYPDFMLTLNDNGTVKEERT